MRLDHSAPRDGGRGDVAQPRASVPPPLAEGLDNLHGRDLIAAALPHLGDTALVSSFGADSIVLLDLVAQVDPTLPVLFIDTQMLFPETLDYQREVAGHLGLRDVRVIRARALELAREDPANIRHLSDTDACCDLRKTRPLARALAPFDAWISGRKRHQSATRSNLSVFERDGHRVKFNPLADWSPKAIAEHIQARDLPRHPLVTQGYPSLGCTPCTSPVAPGEDLRAGRWRNSPKVECGIHFVNGRAIRPPSPETPQ